MNTTPLKTPIILQSSASNMTRSHFAEDAYRIQKHNITATSMNAFDTASCDGSVMQDGPNKGQLIKDLAHRDFWQLIPPINQYCQRRSLHNQQYALAHLDNPVILDSTMFSTGQCQGIFSSDGIINGGTFIGNAITTKSQHYITLNGAINPMFDYNLNEHGEPVPIVLNNARLAGGYNVWILSFADKDYQAVTAENLTDNRGKKHKKGHIYLKNFDLKAFRHEVENNLPYPQGTGSTQKYCESLKDLALKIGVRA